MEQLLGFALYMVAITSIFCILAMSLDLQVGGCGLMNFGQVAFMLLGAYTTAIGVNADVNPYACMVLSSIVAAVFGVLMSLTVKNMSGTYWGILSLSAAELIRLIFLNERWLADGANGLSVLVTVPYLHLTIFVSTVLVYLLMRTVWLSPFGRVIRMIREGDRLPLALGKNVLVFKAETMAIGGAVGGLAGSFYALLNSYISPDDGLPIETFIVWAMIVVGGRGNVMGVVLGTVFVQFLFVGTRFLTNIVAINPDVLSALRLATIGVLIMVVMMWRPQGMIPERKRIYRI